MTVYLPRTSRRLEPIAFARILTHVEPFAEAGLGFYGTNFRPGAEIDTNDHAPPLVVLECAGRAARGRNQPMLWILWTLTHEYTWQKVASAQSFDWTWALTLRPAAIRELLGKAEPPHADLPGITAQIVEALDRELRELPREVRAHLLSGIEVELSARIAAVGWSIQPIGPKVELAAKAPIVEFNARIAAVR